LGVGGPTLTIVIDTTGSMQPEIDSVKETCYDLIDSLQDTPDQPSLYVLSPFNDPSWGPATVTTNPDVFKDAISSLTAYGGDDCAELAYHGLQLGISLSSPGSIAYLFTDASAKDVEMAPSVQSLALSRGVTVVTMLSGRCYGSKRTTRATNPDADFGPISFNTGGQVIETEKYGDSDINNMMNVYMKAYGVNVMAVSTGVVSSSDQITVKVPIDSFMTSVSFSLSSSSTPIMSITYPNGTVVEVTTSNSISSDLARLYVIDSPSPGIYVVSFGQLFFGDISFRVRGTSVLTVMSGFVSMQGRPGHMSLMEIGSLPLEGDNSTYLQFQLSRNVTDLQLTLNDASLNILSTLPASFINYTNSSVGGLSVVSMYDGSLPSVGFFVYATGIDQNGYQFSRLASAFVQPSSVSVQFIIDDVKSDENSITVQPTESEIRVTTVITNYASTDDTFTLSYSDDQGFACMTDPVSPVSVDANSELQIDLILCIPSEAESGVTYVILTATSETTPSVSNYATLAVTVDGWTPNIGVIQWHIYVWLVLFGMGLLLAFLSAKFLSLQIITVVVLTVDLLVLYFEYNFSIILVIGAAIDMVILWVCLFCYSCAPKALLIFIDALSGSAYSVIGLTGAQRWRNFDPNEFVFPTDWKIWLIVSVFVFFFLIGVFIQYILHYAFKDNSHSDEENKLLN
jgi:von Willebrand factor A domain-containing protein 7